MAWSISTHHLPGVNNYERAVTVWENAYKQKNSSWRMLERRAPHKAVRKTDEGSIIFRLYSTDMVIYDPDGTVHIGRHDSVSSAAFVHRLGPVTAFTRNGKMVVATNEGIFQPKNSRLQLKPFEGGYKVVPETAETQHEYVLDKSKAAKLRKMFKPYMDWRAVCARLRDGNARWFGTSIGPMGLQRYIEMGGIPETEYDLLKYASIKNDMLYVIGGAVSMVPMPFGTMPKLGNPYRSAFRAYSHLSSIDDS